MLIGAQWQRDEVAARHLAMITTILPVDQTLAAPRMPARWTSRKDHYLIYVAAAPAYKRHGSVFDGSNLPRDVRAGRVRLW